MRIERVETAWISIECEEPQGLSGGPMTHSTDGLCRITTGDGIRGIGLGRGAPLEKICRLIVEICDNKRQHPAWPDLYDGFPEVRDGHMDCPAGPGWGLEINSRMVRRHGTVIDWDLEG